MATTALTDLQKELDGLERKQESYLGEKIDDRIRELRKIVAESDAAAIDYDGKWQALSDRQAALDAFAETTGQELARACRRPPIDGIRVVIAQELGPIDRLHGWIDWLTGATSGRPEDLPDDAPATTIPAAEKAVADARTAHAAAKTALDRLRGLPKLLDARLKAAEKLQKEIADLAGPAKARYYLAYWLLTGTAANVTDSAGHVLVAAQGLFSEMRGAGPDLVAPAAYKGLLSDAWKAADEAHLALAAAEATLAACTAALAGWKADLAKREKDFETTLRARLTNHPDKTYCDAAGDAGADPTASRTPREPGASGATDTE